MQIYRTTRSCTVHITGYETAPMDAAFGHQLAREPSINTAPAITYSTVPTSRSLRRDAPSLSQVLQRTEWVYQATPAFR